MSYASRSRTSGLHSLLESNLEEAPIQEGCILDGIMERVPSSIAQMLPWWPPCRLVDYIHLAPLCTATSKRALFVACLVPCGTDFDGTAPTVLLQPSVLHVQPDIVALQSRV